MFFVRIRKIFFVLALFFASFNAYSAEDSAHILASSVGEVVLLQDKVVRLEDGMHRSGGFHIYGLIEKIYRDRISYLSMKDKTLFFWSITNNIHLDASFLEDLYILISESCGKELLLMMENFLEKSKKNGIDGSDQKLVAKNKQILEAIMNSK